MIERMFDITEVALAIHPASRIHADLAELAADELTELTPDTLSQRMTELVELRDRIEAELVRTTAAWQNRRAWEADGALSPTAWLTHRTPISRRDATAFIKAGKLINAAPKLAGALHAGDTTAAHVAALARVMSPRRRAVLAEHETVLATEAQRLSIKDFTTLSRRWASLADDHLATDTHDDSSPRNELHASTTMDGWVDIHAHLDPITGAQLVATLDHLAPPDPAQRPEGVRSLPERRGDALADLSAWYLRGDTPGANPPNVTAVIDIATLMGHNPDLIRRRCELDGIGPVVKAVLDQLACSATLSRLVMAGRSEVLDMGREVRFATPAQQRAIRIRDRHCVFNGCDRPAAWCDIHHLDQWAQGGLTDVARMACLCRRHHTLIHNSKWTIETNPDGSFKITHPARAP